MPKVKLQGVVSARRSGLKLTATLSAFIIVTVPAAENLQERGMRQTYSCRMRPWYSQVAKVY